MFFKSIVILYLLNPHKAKKHVHFMSTSLPLNYIIKVTEDH